MALPNVSIILANGGLGRVTPVDDRVVALIINGVEDQPLQIFSPDDAVAHASAVSADYGPNYKAQIADFYKEAGIGAELWILPTDPTKSTPTLFSTGLVEKLIRMSDGRINVIGFSRYVKNEAAPVRPAGYDPDAATSLDEAQAFAEFCANTLHAPIRIIMDGKWASNALGDLENLKVKSYNRVAVCVASNQAGAHHSCMGQLLGRIAASKVNQSIGRVRSGQVKADAAYITNGNAVRGTTFQSDVEATGNKGYILFRTFPGKAGFYWNEAHMCVADSDDYATLELGRVIDKASRIAYNTFVDELNDTVLVDQNTGRIVATTVKMYQSRIERAITLQMAAEGEISGVSCYVDPTQDILGTSQLNVDLRITPTGTARVINVTLGFFNPNAA